MSDSVSVSRALAFALSISGLLAVHGCNDSDSSSGDATGGAVSDGGVTGGAPPSSAQGGSTGGSDSAPRGGTPASGGQSNTGGARNPVPGGMTGDGGLTASTGGSATTGGAANGGSSLTGGSAPTGGAESMAEPCPTESEDKFSFFVVSQRALAEQSGNPDGFGGDLGGITGADGICQRVAESVSPCQKNKVWHAFLSTTEEDAIDRIGSGPWYDRNGRLLGETLEDLTQERPAGDPAFVNDLTTEDGTPSRNPDGTGTVDNHEILTGSGLDGRLYTQDSEPGQDRSMTSCGGEDEWTPEKATCWNWTNNQAMGCPRVGHSWPRQGSGLHWISVWNEAGCLPGGDTSETGAIGLDGTRRVGSAGGYGGFYCFAVMPHP